MKSDLDIAREAKLVPIQDIAWKMGFDAEEIVQYGGEIAKIKWSALKKRVEGPKGFLVLVTSVNPTPFGEGKTVTTIGLTQALNRIGKNACCVIREPSMGPVFGIKGGAAGGGYSQVLPMEEINLHFTGDLHAVTSTHNLLSSLIDNHIKHGNELDIDSSRISWPRVLDLNDRAMRQIAIGLGGPANGNVREERFDITAASEIMAILALSSDYADLKKRLGGIVIGQRKNGFPVLASDLQADGAMALLLRDALMPNLVQTIEGDPAFIHCGPFANIAHGNSSIIADKLALRCTDYVITEAGFGSDMGAEKFMHIKTPASGNPPDCVVVNVTVRSMKLHGGAFGKSASKRPSPELVRKKDVEAVISGAETNLTKHIKNMLMFGIPVIVSINRFYTDHDDEVEALMKVAEKAGASACVETNVHADGGNGGAALAEAVVANCQTHMAAGRPFTPLFNNEMPVIEKALRIATRIYGAEGINLYPKAHRDLEQIQKWGYGHLPICMAKTQYSLSHDAGLLGSPNGFEIPIRELRLNSGAGFIVAILGNIMTMPGLPKIPAATNMTIDEDGELKGMFS
ncbi:MAG: formate--tetrahydrofolate ligase [Candidatus Thermoplasmatota archaeon]|nr:formate--tetrahydrofolate ligase [Candidatus Thermoplasmatota archaeon]